MLKNLFGFAVVLCIVFLSTSFVFANSTEAVIDTTCPDCEVVIDIACLGDIEWTLDLMYSFVTDIHSVQRFDSNGIPFDPDDIPAGRSLTIVFDTPEAIERLGIERFDSDGNKVIMDAPLYVEVTVKSNFERTRNGYISIETFLFFHEAFVNCRGDYYWTSVSLGGNTHFVQIFCTGRRTWGMNIMYVYEGRVNV